VSGSFDSHFPAQAQGRARSGRQRDTCVQPNWDTIHGRLFWADVV